MNLPSLPIYELLFRKLTRPTDSLLLHILARREKQATVEKSSCFSRSSLFSLT